MMKKRFLSTICVLALCLGLLPATALADGDGNYNVKVVCMSSMYISYQGEGQFYGSYDPETDMYIADLTVEDGEYIGISVSSTLTSYSDEDGSTIVYKLTGFEIDGTFHGIETFDSDQEGYHVYPTSDCTITVVYEEYQEFSLGASVTSLDFGTVTEGYETSPTAQTVTITNDGIETLQVKLPQSEYYNFSFAETEGSTEILKASESTTISVQPKLGLSAGDYSESITVYADKWSDISIMSLADTQEQEHDTSCCFDVSFKVLDTYTISFDANGGTGTMDAVEVGACDYTLPVCAFAAPEGMQFKAWAVGSVEGTQYSAEDVYAVTGDVTLYAIWEAIPTFEISVSPAILDFGTVTEGYETSPTAQTVTITNDGIETIQVKLPQSEYYNFSFAETEGSTEILKASESTTISVQPKLGLSAGDYSESITVYADKWSDISIMSLADTQEQEHDTSCCFDVSFKVLDTYTISFDANGGTGTMDAVEVGACDYTLPVCAFAAPEGMQFKAWAVGSVEGTQYSAEDVYAVTGDVTLYAIWEAIPTFEISVSPASLDFGSRQEGDTSPDAQVVTVTNTGNQAVTLTQPTAENYEIGTLSRTVLQPNETATFTVQPKAGLTTGSYDETISVMGSDGVGAEVTASFTVDPVTTYTLTFETNGGSEVASVTVQEGTTISLNDYQTTRDGYSFQGWYADSELTSKVTSVTMEQDMTVYAGWSANTASPKTGDNSNMMLWIFMLFVSAGILLGIAAYGKRKK